MIQMKQRDDNLEAKIKQLQMDVEMLKKRPIGVSKHEFDYLKRDVNDQQTKCNVNENKLNQLIIDLATL